MRFDPDQRSLPPTISWGLIESGLWMRLGIAGGAVAAASPFLAFAGELAPGPALIALAGGAAIAGVAYRRVRTLLGAQDAIEAAAPAVPRRAAASAHAA